MTMHILVGSDIDYKRYFKPGKKPWWLVPKKAKKADDALLFFRSRGGICGRGRLIRDAALDDSDDSEVRYNAKVEILDQFTPPLSLEDIKKQLPDWGWPTYPRGYTTLSEQHENRLMEMIGSVANPSGASTELARRRPGRAGTSDDLPTGEQWRRGTPEGLVCQRRHNELQNHLKKLLGKAWGKEAVMMEEDHIDLCVKTDSGLLLVEVKVSPSARLALREALGQIFEYAFFKKEKDEKVARLAVVASPKLGEQDREYLEYLREIISLPLDYVPFQQDDVDLPPVLMPDTGGRS